ncbi:MAG: recombinase family protein [Thiomonas sp.]
MALIGYTRVSTAEQDTALQTDALGKAGSERIFEDRHGIWRQSRPAGPGGGLGLCARWRCADELLQQ